MKSLDLRKTRASTVVEDMGDDNFEVFNEDKESPFAGLQESLQDIKPQKIVWFAIKIAVCASGVLVLKYFEQKNLDELNHKKSVAQTELNNLKSKEKNILAEIDKFKHLSDRALEFENKLSIVEEIANRRLSALRALDGIQDVIPKEVWLDQVRYNDNKFKISGMSTTNKQVQTLIERLESTGLFSAVTLEKSSEDKRGRYSRRKFSIMSALR